MCLINMETNGLIQAMEELMGEDVKRGLLTEKEKSDALGMLE